MGDLRAPYVVPLGVSPALPEPGESNTYLAVVRAGRYWLVDCAGAPIQSLGTAGLDPLMVQGIFITHFHPDHVYGFPAFLLGLFLLAQVRDYAWIDPLMVYARPEVLAQVQSLVNLFAGQGWLEELPLRYREVAPQLHAPVAQTQDFIVTAAPACHSVPALAVRFASRDTGRAFVYSGDTADCEEVEQLATGARLLIHEASGAGYGHSDGVWAAAVAARAGVERLGLIHYPRDAEANTRMMAEVHKVFDGPAELMRPYVRYAW